MTIGLPTLPSPERRTTSTRTWAALALVLVVIAGSVAAWWQVDSAESDADPGVEAPLMAALDDTTARAPQGTRVRVRVVNTSGVTGLARRTTQHLRDYGFDVVDFGSGKTDKSAVTRITVHTGHPDWAARVKKALGVGTIGTDADTSRYVDLTVYVGRDWRPPAEALRP